VKQESKFSSNGTNFFHSDPPYYNELSQGSTFEETIENRRFNKVKSKNVRTACKGSEEEIKQNSFSEMCENTNGKLAKRENKLIDQTKLQNNENENQIN